MKPTSFGPVQGNLRIVQDGHCFAIVHPQVRADQRVHLLSSILSYRGGTLLDIKCRPRHIWCYRVLAGVQDTGGSWCCQLGLLGS